MTLCKHELKSNRISLLIWSVVVASMTMLTMLLYPHFKDQTASLSSMFALMGPFTAALGLDRIDFTTALGFYGIEAGTMLSVGGALFAAMTGIGMLAKEEGGHTAEFLLTLPISRTRVVVEKLLALVLLLLGFNLFCFAAGWITFPLIHEPLLLGRFMLFHGLQWMMQMEIACVCFGLSAFVRRAQVGVGLGLALLLYFLSLIVNMLDAVRFLRYFTPFSYAEASVILTGGAVEGVLVCIGAGVTLLSIGAAFWQYGRKDIAL